MIESKNESPRPLADQDGSPIFEEGWQAQVMALAFNLIDSGHFTAVQWSEALGAELATANKQNDTPQTYYSAVLTALEKLLDQQESVSSNSLNQRTEAWRKAYLSTPHGQPVTLPDEQPS